MIKLFGKVSAYDIDTNKITLILSFVTPDILDEIESKITQQNICEFLWKPKYKKTTQYHQQKCWYGSLALILKAQEVQLTKEVLHTEDLEQRESIFPVVEYERLGKIKCRPKRMSECSFNEMQQNIETLHRRNQHFKINGKLIDFSNLKLK